MVVIIFYNEKSRQAPDIKNMYGKLLSGADQMVFEIKCEYEYLSDLMNWP